MKYLYEMHMTNTKSSPFILNPVTLKNVARCGYNWHQNIELIYVIKGEGTMLVDGILHTIKEGDLININSNSAHSPGTETDITYYYLLPDIDFCQYNGIDTNVLKLQTCIHDAHANLLFENILECVDSTHPLSETQTKIAFLSLLCYLAEHYTLQDTSTQEKPITAIQSIRLAQEYIRTHFTEKLSIEEIADFVGFSKYHFLREFKRLIGTTPISYINALRCKKAKDLLLSTNLSIAELHKVCGFRNKSYFAKKFKEFYKIPPLEFRNNKNPFSQTAVWLEDHLVEIKYNTKKTPEVH